MGYTKNKNAIDRVESFLKLMVESETSLSWETADPRRLAYYLREGIASAEHMIAGRAVLGEEETDLYRSIMELRLRFVIKIKDNKVIASLRNEIPIAIASVENRDSAFLPNISTLTEIIGAISQYIFEDKKTQVVISNPDITEEEFDKLALYTQKKELSLIKSDSEGLIIKRKKS